MENQIRVCENKAIVVGKLKEKNINFISKDGKLMATGYLVIVTNTKYGKGEIRVSVLQNALTKDGKENTLYKGLQTVQNEYKSILQVGSEEAADLVKIEGNLTDDTYFNTKKNEFVEKIGIRASFINRIERVDKAGKTIEDCSKVALEGYIAEINQHEEELQVKFVSVGYGGVAVPVECYIPKQLVIPFQGRHQVGQTTTLNFDIVNSVETNKVQEEVGFGEGLGEEITRTITKNVVFGGGAIDYTNGYTNEDVQQSMSRRAAVLDTKKEKALKKESNGSFGAPNGGFSTQGQQGFTVQNQSQGGFTAGGFNGGVVGGFSMPTGNFGV